MSDSITPLLLSWCREIRVLPVRWFLDGAGTAPSVPLVRSVLGCALHDLNAAAYVAVFRRDQAATREAGTAQGFVLAGRPGGGLGSYVLDMTLVGGAVAHWPSVEQALRLAMARGIGSDRSPVEVVALSGRAPDGQLRRALSSWSLDEARWPVPDDGESRVCTLEFWAPLRLQAHRRLANGRWSDRRALTVTPRFSNLAAAALLRLEAYLPTALRRGALPIRRSLVAEAEAIPSDPWQGTPTVVERWSATQRRELVFPGITGRIRLPQGAGPFRPAFAAAQWLQLGKNTTHGFGAFDVVAHDVEPLQRALHRDAS